MLSNVYLKAPPYLQNLGLSLYGAKLYRERFSGDIPPQYREASDPFTRSTTKEYQAQADRFFLLLKHCADYVPYYKKFLRGVNLTEITPSNLSSFLPKLTKASILENSQELLSTHPSFRKNLLKLNTSGSSGTPLTIYSSREARRINYFFYEQLLRFMGTTYRARSTTFAGRILYKEDSKRLDRYDKFNKTQYLSSYFISNRTIGKYIQALNDWQPEFIDSYPSALYELQLLARDKGLSINFKPKFILTSSETLTPHARAEIEAFFGTKVVDHYGCTEMAVSAFSKGEQYYASPLFAVMELETQGDSRFSLVTTGLLNFAMPLLRYEIGDCVVSRDATNPYIFEHIDGRMDDVIITPEGRRIGRIDPAFKGIAGVNLAQVVQEEIDKIVVKLVLNKEKKHLFCEELLIKNLKERTSSFIQIEVVYEEAIEKGHNGKFKSVISKVNR